MVNCDANRSCNKPFPGLSFIFYISSDVQIVAREPAVVIIVDMLFSITVAMLLIKGLRGKSMATSPY